MSRAPRNVAGAKELHQCFRPFRRANEARFRAVGRPPAARTAVESALAAGGRARLLSGASYDHRTCSRP